MYSVYKSPTERFVLPVLGHRNLPHIVNGIAALKIGKAAGIDDVQMATCNGE